MVCGILTRLLLWLLDIPMLTRPKTLRIEKPHMVLVFLLVIVLQLGLVRNKTLYPYLLLKMSILLLGAIVRTSYGWSKCFKDYGIEQETMNIHCDNYNAINILTNLVLHSHTKHIEIPHHFIRDLVEKQVVSLEFVPTEHQFADILTKPLDSLRFEYLRKFLGIFLIDWSSWVWASKLLSLVFTSFCFLWPYFVLDMWFLFIYLIY